MCMTLNDKCTPKFIDYLSRLFKCASASFRLRLNDLNCAIRFYYNTVMHLGKWGFQRQFQEKAIPAARSERLTVAQAAWRAAIQ